MSEPTPDPVTTSTPSGPGGEACWSCGATPTMCGWREDPCCARCDHASRPAPSAPSSGTPDSGEVPEADEQLFDIESLRIEPTFNKRRADGWTVDIIDDPGVICEVPAVGPDDQDALALARQIVGALAAPSPVPVDGERPAGELRPWIDRLRAVRRGNAREADAAYAAVLTSFALSLDARPAPAPPVDEPAMPCVNCSASNGSCAAKISRGEGGCCGNGCDHRRVGQHPLFQQLADPAVGGERRPVDASPACEFIVTGDEGTSHCSLAETRPVDVTALPEWAALRSAIDGSPYLAGSGRIGLAATALLAAADRGGEG